MEGEINNFIMVWTIVLMSLYYCHKIGCYFTGGNIIRPLTILPVICLFFLIPLNLTTSYLGGTTSFFVAWLANFKLILFAFEQGPLSSNPPIPLSRFVALACLPIKAAQNPPSTTLKSRNSTKAYNAKEKFDLLKQNVRKGHKSLQNYVLKIMILLVCIQLYRSNQFFDPTFIWLIHCVHLYISLELLLAIVAALAQAVMKVELEPQFDEPYLATSLQDFWGRRWNLMVSNILRPTIYQPVRSFCTGVAGANWAPIPAVLVTFLVSGLMHELIFYNYLRHTPTGEITCFFLVNGASLAVEIGFKRVLHGRFSLPRILSRSLTLTFVVCTSFWLFFSPLLRAKADVQGCRETLAIIEFFKSGRLISPNELSCPFFE